VAAAGHQLTRLDSGVRIVTEAMPSVRSAALGFFIGTGSRSEARDEAGLSHLLEHLIFRGTGRFSSLEIDQIFDGMGAELNAGTGKESTSVYSRVLDRHIPRAFDIMADMVWRPTLAEADAERQVVLEEIAMYEDDPQDKVFDVLGAAVFGDDPLGRPIIGRAEVIADTPVGHIADFHRARYVPANVVVAAAGSIDHDQIVALAQATLGSAGTGAPAGDPPVPPARPPEVRFERKDTEQYHLCLGGPGLARDDDRRYALRVMDAILGGTSSSRLFQEIRERRGLAYSVHSFASQYHGTGQVGLYVGTRGENVAEALGVIGEELRRFQAGPATADELDRARENVKGRIVLSLESTGTRMHRLGSSVLAGLPIPSLDELIERIDAVSLSDLEGLAAELFAVGRLSAAGIGPDEDRFREALAPVSEELAAA
jgi:predicted Zn-dependent peptidase